MPHFVKRLLVGIAVLFAAFLLWPYFARTNAPAQEVFVDQAPQVDALPAAWVQELFEHATLRESKQKDGAFLSVYKVAPWSTYSKKHTLLRFNIRLVADDIVYTYTHGVDSARDSLLSVRIEHPGAGIFMLIYADHKSHNTIKVVSAAGNTALPLPFDRRSRYKNEHNEWKGRLNAALLALARTVNKPPPKGTWQ
ncbi:MAG: hypothetical protein WCK46_01230 [Candidatus Adlerbacteria bacterium]